MRIVWKIIKLLIGAILGLFLANKFNLFSYFPFVPEEYALDICVTVYITLAEILIDEGFDWLCKYITNQVISDIEVIMTVANSNADISYNPEIRFNSEGLAEANINVKINGRRKDFDNCKIVLRRCAIADIQNNYKTSGVSVDSNGDYRIDIYSLFGGSQERTTLDFTFKISLAEVPVDGESAARLEPEFENKKVNVILKKNYAMIRTVR